jgi:hypothetical protein
MHTAMHGEGNASLCLGAVPQRGAGAKPVGDVRREAPEAAQIFLRE